MYLKYRDLTIEGLFGRVSDASLERAIDGDSQDPAVLKTLLSPWAESCLERMAERSHDITMRHFGKTIQLYAPLYLSNYCDNQCLYCGFNAKNDIERKKLTLDEVVKEAEHIAATGIRHILILTGESRAHTPLSYIRDCVKALTGYFDSIAVEIYPLAGHEYAELVAEGVDGLTLYQELYDEELYKKMHPAGPKSDYRSRLDAPERGAKSGMRSVSIGVLLGLADWRREAFFMGLHARYLQNKFPDVDIGISVPRIRPQVSDFKPAFGVSDMNIVQLITAMRIFFPRASISVSTREYPAFRENLIPLGVTRMSAGSVTSVGGYAIGEQRASQTEQFEIMDHRSVKEVCSMLEKRGYQPVFKDWVRV